MFEILVKYPGTGRPDETVWTAFVPQFAGDTNSLWKEFVEEAVALALDWETNVTRMINDMVALAIKESEYLSQNMLGWFVNEQLVNSVRLADCLVG